MYIRKLLSRAISLRLQTQPVTARALETLIRLSTAHAKARLSVNVLAEDAEAAIEMVQYAYFKKVGYNTKSGTMYFQTTKYLTFYDRYLRH